MKKLSDFKNTSDIILNYQLHDPQFIGIESNEAMDILYKFALNDISSGRLLDLNCLRLDLKHFCVVNNTNIVYRGLNLRESLYNGLAILKYPNYQDSFNENISEYDYSIFINSDSDKFQDDITKLIPKLLEYKFQKLIILTKDVKGYSELVEYLKSLNLDFSIEFSKLLNYIKIILL